MDKKDFLIITVIIALVVLVILFWDNFIIRREELVEVDYCEYDFECVYAINIIACCSCPMPMNIKVIKLDGDYEIYNEEVDYSRGDCNYKGCATACPTIGNLSCINNKCIAINKN
jgi:hypothetical protein